MQNEWILLQLRIWIPNKLCARRFTDRILTLKQHFHLIKDLHLLCCGLLTEKLLCSLQKIRIIFCYRRYVLDDLIWNWFASNALLGVCFWQMRPDSCLACILFPYSVVGEISTGLATAIGYSTWLLGRSCAVLLLQIRIQSFTTLIASHNSFI